jgi:L-fuculose-phosphate aldolase
MIPFRMLYTEAEKIADVVSLTSPVLIVENDCVLTVGTDVLAAFDRLEVVEYSARSLIDAAGIGRLVPIGEQDIGDLEVAFSLSK